jgi:hypothetical protein
MTVRVLAATAELLVRVPATVLAGPEELPDEQETVTKRTATSPSSIPVRGLKRFLTPPASPPSATAIIGTIGHSSARQKPAPSQAVFPSLRAPHEGKIKGERGRPNVHPDFISGS